MNTITYSQRYLPHELNTKFYAVRLYRTGVGVSFVCRRYHISKSSLLPLKQKFNGTKESLMDKSHRPHSKHPNSHTEEELKWIQDYIDAIQTSQYVNYMANFVPTKDTPDIPAPSIMYTDVLAISAILLLARISISQSLTIRHQN